MLKYMAVFLFCLFPLHTLISQVVLADSKIDLNHSKWNTLLSETVVTSQNKQVTRLNYALLKTKDAQLSSYLNDLSAVTEAEFKAVSRNDQMAFLINAYNAGIAKLIVDKYPISSIKKIGIPLVGPWKNTFIKLFGRSMSPDDLEHGTLRKNYQDSRIHFGVNCASVSCPSLRASAYTGSQIQAQLNEQAQLFFENKSENSYDPVKSELRLNSILKWFREDFTKTDDSELVTYVARYLPALSSTTAKIKIIYNEYDWTLNDIKSP
jgi:hypothetical protein